MSFLSLAIGLVLLGGGCAIAFRKVPVVSGNLCRSFVVLGCAIAVFQAVAVLKGQRLPVFRWTPPLPWGPWQLGLDGLSAWFLLISCLIGGATAWGGVTYLWHHPDQQRVSLAHACFSLLIAAVISLSVAR